MRKLFFVWLIITLAALSCTSWGAEVSSYLEALDDFGVHMTYKTNASVVLRSGETPYYANVTGYEGQKVSLAGMKKKNYYGDLPYGTLTVISGDNSSSGSHYPLMPSWGEAIVDYHYGSNWSDIDKLAGQRIMWNIYTSPDVKVGSMTVPKSSDISIPVNGIVPYVELTGSGGFESARLYFTELGKTESVDVDDVSRVLYTLTNRNGNILRNEEHSDFSGELTFGVEVPEDDFRNITIEYDRGLATYIWTFEFLGVESTYELGVLDEERPLKIQLGESKEVTIKLPSTLELEVDPEGNINVPVYSINSDVLGVFDISYDIGGFSWNDDLTSNDNKTSITFHLNGDNPGRTALKIDTPDNSFIREVWVLDEDGNLPEQDELPDLNIEVNVHESHARHIANKPFYPSAEFSGLELIVTGDEDAFTTGSNEETGEVFPSWGVIGFNKGDESTLLNMYVDYNEANSEAGADKFYVAGNITTEDLSGYSVWWDIQYKPEFNVVSASIADILVDKEFMTTEEQLKNFVPYFELKNSKNYTVTSLEWSFINPSTGEKVEPEISDLTILAFNKPPAACEGTSGIIIIGLNDWTENGARIIFEYTYDEVKYRWIFDGMEYNPSYAYLPYVSLTVGTSSDFTIFAFPPVVDAVESFCLFVSSPDVFTVDPTSSDNVTGFKFTVEGLKTTDGYPPEHLFLVTKRRGFSAFDSYVYNNNDVRIYTEDDPQPPDDDNPGFNDTFVSGDIDVTVRCKPRVSVIEGETYYYGDMPKAPVVELMREDFITPEVFDEYYDVLKGTLHFYSGDNQIDSVSVEPHIGVWTWSSNREYVKVAYGEYNCPEGTTRISWEFTNDSNKSGNENIPSIKAVNFKPYVKLNREGLNAKSVECWFVDGNNNRISYPSDISNLSLRVQTYSYMDFETESIDVPLPVDVPEIHISRIRIDFKYEGMNYRYNFYPVDNSASYWEPYEISGDIFTWNTASPDYPLVMKVGDVRTVTLRTNNISSPEAVIGDSSVVGMETLSVSDNSLIVRLTAKSAGMTSLAVRMNPTTKKISTWPREIWVADSNGKVPHLTDNIDELFNELISGDDNIRHGGGGGGSQPEPSPEPDEPVYDETSKDVGIPGLSVYPRFAMPKYPSDEAFKSMLDFMSTLELGELEDFVYSENISIIESVDALEMFNKLSADLISKDTPQLLAVVLPEFEVKSEGFYMFRIPIDNVTNPGTAIFFVSGEIEESESVNVSAVPMTEDEAKDSLENDRILFITDNGEPANIISGDEYINVAAYFSKGTYSPVITAAATSNDVSLILAKISPDVPVPPISDDVSPDVPVPPLSPDVPVPPGSNDVSPDVPVQPESPDVPVTPESPDVPVTPESPDVPVQPESPDVPVTPVSDDVSSDVPVPTESDDQPGDNNNGGGGNGGNTTPELKPEPAIPEAPAVNVEEVAEKVIGILQSLSESLSRLIDSDTKVSELPESASGSERSIDDVSDEDLALIPDDQTPAYILPVITVTEPGIYMFGLTLDNLEPGAPIYLLMMSDTSANSEAFASSESDTTDAYTFLDDEGNEVKTVPKNQHVNVAAYMEAGTNYAPVITTDAATTGVINGPGGNSGGCDSGFSVYALTLACLSVILRRKR